MEVNSIRKVFDLINNLNHGSYDLDYKVRKIDYCYELKVGDYIIYFEDIPHIKNLYIEVSYKCKEHINLKLSKRNVKCFRLIFNLLLINYMRNLEFNLSRTVDSR